MKIETDNTSNYGHLERPNLFKALQEAYALQKRILINIHFHTFLLHSMGFYRRVSSATSSPSRAFLPTEYC